MTNIQVNSAVRDADDAILFRLVVDGEQTTYAYRADDPYSGEIGQYLTEWLVDNLGSVQPYVPPPPMSYTVRAETLWNRMTDEEAEEFDAAMTVASPLRLRKQFNLAVSFASDSELFGFTRGVLLSVFEASRVDAILAE